MKKITSTIIAAILIFTIGCKKKEDVTPYTCATCKTTPDALVANDASSKGVYKGIVTGSSGIIVFSILNGNTAITATLVLDGVTASLTTTTPWVANTAFNAVFTGTLSSNPISITFGVNANGSNPIVSAFNIIGHTGAVFVLVKETSLALIECFEGNYTSTRPETGIFNLLLSRTTKVYGGYSYKLTGAGGNGGSFDGTITTTNELKDNSSGGIFGILAGDVINGTFLDGNGRTITISSNRTW